MTLSPEREVNDPRQWLAYVPPTLAHTSPLYAHLYQNMQHDPELFALLALIDTDQPIPVLFFSVVTFLVLKEREHPFAQFYPYLASPAKDPGEAYPAFRAFCLAHLDELQALLPTARLQTNEVRRCTHLLPAFELVFKRAGSKPLALIEIGASAGLNLNWQHYGYQYGSHCAGNPASPVHMHCELSGTHMPPLPETLPVVAQCYGIELLPLDLASERDVRWLCSCIWPEESERYQLLDAAIALARQDIPPVLTGDASELLPDLLPTLPPEQTVCLFHSFALNQGPAKIKERIIQTLCIASIARPIYRISLEANPLHRGLPRLELFTYWRGHLFQYEWLAECDFHGERMEWLCS